MGGRIGVAAGALGIVRKVKVIANQSWAAISSEAELEIIRMESLLVVTSTAYELNHPESGLLSSLAKVYCTEKCMEILKAIYNSPGCGSKQRIQIAQDVKDAAILRITEGPNDPIAYRCALEIMMMNDIDYNQEEIASESVCVDSDKFRQQEILREYKQIIMIISENFRPLSGRQRVLSYVMSSTMSVYSWLCTKVMCSLHVEESINVDSISSDDYQRIQDLTLEELRKCKFALNSEMKIYCE